VFCHYCSYNVYFFSPLVNHDDEKSGKKYKKKKKKIQKQKEKEEALTNPEFYENYIEKNLGKRTQS